MIIRTTVRALSRVRISIVTIAVTYTISVIVGVVMVHSGNQFANNYRDNLVANAQQNPIRIAFREGD